MPLNVQQRGSKFQLRVTHPLLPKAFFFTFEQESDAWTQGNVLHAMLEAGTVPTELLADKPKAKIDPVVTKLLMDFQKLGDPSPTDLVLIKGVWDDLIGLRVSSLTYQWARSYVRTLKVERNFAPATVRTKIGVIARAIDWHIREHYGTGDAPIANPLRMLPRGYSRYSQVDKDLVIRNGGQPKVDNERDRRLDQAETTRILDTLAGVKRPDRQRPFPVDQELTMLFKLIVDTGLRLREAYWLEVQQVNLSQRTLNVQGTKGHRGVIKPRSVPIKRALMEPLREFIGTRTSGLLFGFWDGDPAKLNNVTSRLSQRFRSLFEYADVKDFHEHDLRHEATCRWFEQRRQDGNWSFSEMEVIKIMGWSASPSGAKMAKRYASIRGVDLAARLDD